MTTPRDFAAVLDAVIGEVPPEETALRAALTQILDESRYRAPEVLWPLSGRAVAQVLEMTFHSVAVEELVAGWRRKVLAAWSGSP